MDLNEKENSGRTLRDAAEETLSRSSDTMPELKDKTLEEIIQNEELKRVQLELEHYKEKYKNRQAVEATSTSVVFVVISTNYRIIEDIYNRQTLL